MRSARRWIASLALGIAGGACATGEDPAETVKRANASLEESGAPFRWEHEDAGEGDAVIRRVLIGTPAPSAADAQLQGDVRALIGRAEAMKGRSADVHIVETRALPPEGASVREAWVVDAGKDGHQAYLIVFTPSASGGTEISLSGPWGVTR
jgi:hypothetical protein